VLANTIYTVEISSTLYDREEDKEVLSLISSHHSSENLAMAIKQEKNIKGINIGEEEENPSIWM
jgi:hypothetical protein